MLDIPPESAEKRFWIRSGISLTLPNSCSGSAAEGFQVSQNWRRIRYWIRSQQLVTAEFPTGSAKLDPVRLPNFYRIRKTGSARHCRNSKLDPLQDPVRIKFSSVNNRRSEFAYSRPAKARRQYFSHICSIETV